MDTGDKKHIVSSILYVYVNYERFKDIEMMLFVLKPIIQYHSNEGKERKERKMYAQAMTYVVDCGLVACEWLSILAHCFSKCCCNEELMANILHLSISSCFKDCICSCRHLSCCYST